MISRCIQLLFTGVLLLVASSGRAAAESNPFFAMNTIARGGPEAVVPMLQDLGYDGLGGAAGDAAMPDAKIAKGTARRRNM